MKIMIITLNFGTICTVPGLIAAPMDDINQSLPCIIFLFFGFFFLRSKRRPVNRITLRVYKAICDFFAPYNT